jgi:hypothetical protein
MLSGTWERQPNFEDLDYQADCQGELVGARQHLDVNLQASVAQLTTDVDSKADYSRRVACGCCSQHA